MGRLIDKDQAAGKVPMGNHIAGFRGDVLGEDCEATCRFGYLAGEEDQRRRMAQWLGSRA